MTDSWSHGTPSSQLAPGQIHVWTVELEASDFALAHSSAGLSADELERAGRFRIENVRRRYILCRGVLRELLARYLGCPPEVVALCYGPRGKPSIAAGSPIRFNVSHSSDLALFAFSLGCELGVDIERIRPVKDRDAIAAQFFCPAEVADLRSLRPEERDPAFFRCWTRKEAYIKAVGDGLYIDLDSFQVTLLPGDPARFVHIEDDANGAGSWVLHDLCPALGYAGALAYHGNARSVAMRPVTTAEDILLVTGADCDV